MRVIYYLNGELVHHDRAKISLLDYGFLYGYGLYETLRAYEGKPFRLDNHLARLRFSGDKLGIVIHIALLREAVNEVIKANGFIQTRIRINITAGEGSMLPNLDSCQTPTIAVLASEYAPIKREKYLQGYRAIISSIKRNSQSPVTYLKSSNSLENILARVEAKKAGVDEILFLNEKGNLTEAAGSNLFLVKDGTLFTPRFESGILPGVTRIVVFELAQKLQIKVKENNVKPSALTEVDEAFVTNSMIEIMPLTEVGGRLIGDGNPGVITKKLAIAYSKLVKKETK